MGRGPVPDAPHPIWHSVRGAPQYCIRDCAQGIDAANTGRTRRSPDPEPEAPRLAGSRQYACEPLPESPKGGGTVELLAEWRDSALCGRVRGGGVEGDAEASGEGRS